MIATLGEIASAGKRASPSLDIALPISAAKGIRPFMYKVVTKICGPQPGINPIATAMSGKSQNAELNRAFKSMLVQ